MKLYKRRFPSAVQVKIILCDDFQADGESKPGDTRETIFFISDLGCSEEKSESNRVID